MTTNMLKQCQKSATKTLKMSEQSPREHPKWLKTQKISHRMTSKMLKTCKKFGHEKFENVGKKAPRTFNIGSEPKKMTPE